MGVPALVLVIHAPGGSVARQADDPETLHLLEVGQIEAGLARL
jgi:hypothetical protein